MFTMNQLIAHLIGDYFLQSDWQALNKHKVWEIALLHCLLYSLPFLFFHPSFLAWTFIVGTHFFIDHFQLTKYVCYAHNWISLKRPKSWQECAFNGYDPERPLWITVWLYIITDNTLHLICNGIAFKYL